MFNIPAWGMIQLCTGAKGKDVITSSAHWINVFAKRSKQVTKDLAAHHWPTKQSHRSNRILSFGFGACSPVVTVSYRSMKKGAPGYSMQLYWVLFPPAMLSRGFFLLRERYTKFFVQNLGIPQFSSERERFRCVLLLHFFVAETLTTSAGFMAPNWLCHPVILPVHTNIWTTLIVSEAD